LLFIVGEKKTGFSKHVGGRTEVLKKLWRKEDFRRKTGEKNEGKLCFL